MNLSPPKLQARFRRRIPRDDAVSDPTVVLVEPDGPAQTPTRATTDGVRPGAESTKLGWRSSSDDLKHGLDVVELPTSLPVDVLDRLFNAPAR